MVKKIKAKEIVILMRSVVSDHTFQMKRPRVGDKLEVWRYDPLIQQQCLFKEEKKVLSLRPMPWESKK